LRRLLGSFVVALAVVAAGAAGGGVSPGVSAPSQQLVSNVETLEFVPGELLVRFKPGVSASQQRNVLSQRDGRVERSLKLPRLKLVRVPQGADVKAAAAAFARRAEVAYAEPNWLRRPDATPNDTRFGELWGLHQASDADIDAPEAWDVTTGSSGVIVAVVDTGVSYQHPDLAGNMWPGIGWDFVQNDATPFDYDSHGTHVAGTIGAQGNNSLGVTGVNWDVSIMALRACCVNGQFPDSTIVDAFAYACANGAKVVNGSFGSANLGVAIRDAVLACPSVLFVFSSGNEGKDLDGSGAANDAYPCELHRPPTNAPNVLCVGATQEDDTTASFSNHGTQAVHLMAPGNAILSTWPDRDPVGSTFDNFETDIAGRWTPTGSWAWTTEASASPTHSITDSPGGNYANSINSPITRVGTIDLTGQIGCAVEYNLRLATQSGDFLRLDTSTDGVNWTQLIGWSGSSAGDFIPMADDVSVRDGTPNVHFRYRLTSNSSGQDNGAHIDDFAFACLDTDGEDYNAINGTSMASPHVSGVAGLLLAQNPGRTVAELKTVLTDKVDAMASLADKAISQGRLNACRALGGTDLECGPSPPPPPPLPPPAVDQSLDDTFGAGGVATAAFGDPGTFDTAFGVARQADGKLVMAGNSGGGFSFGSGGSFALARFDANGGIDATFGGDGLVTTDFVATAGKADEARAVLVQPDGKIVAAGIADLGTLSTVGDFAVARYNVDGTLDNTFSDDGMVTTNIGHDNIWGAALQDDGKIVVVGNSSGDFGIVRFNTNGTLDTTFSGDGKLAAVVGAGISDEAHAVTVQPDDKILVAGTAEATTFNPDFAVARFNSDGTFDTSFGGGDGIATVELRTHPTFDDDEADALLLQPDGKIVLAGHATVSLPGGGAGGVFALARFNADGTLDTSFSDDGKVVTPSISPNGSTSFIHALGLQPGGKIVAAGTAANFDPGTGFFHRDFALARYNADGSLDTSFDGDGKLTTQIAPPGQLDIARGLVIQPDNKIVLAGYADVGPPEFVDLDFVIARYQADGDSFPPDTSIDSGPSGPTNDATPTFTFSASEAGTTFSCRVDAAAFAVCSSPHTTASLAEGGHTFEVRATDQAGNVDPTPASRGFTVDTIPPDTTIDAGPSGLTNDATPTFSFSSEGGATFQCRVDSDPFATCTSPHTTATLGQGPHTFEVRATDAAGNTDGSPASREFTVDTDPPETTIDSGPANGSFTNDSTPTFEFSSEPGASFQCRVAPAAFATCLSPHTTAALADGARTFDVRATDAAGNTGAAASRSFTVDTDPPETTIDSGPANGSFTNDSTPTFEFSSEPGASFECRLDSSVFATCTSPHTLGPLNDGGHSFEVQATDEAGNVGPAASRSFTVDTQGPLVSIDSGPAGRTNDSTPTFTFSADEPVTFHCKVDGEPFDTCSGPGDSHTTVPLPDGAHEFSVRGTDAVGFTATETRSFTVDTVPPETQIDSGPPAFTNDSTPTFTFSSNEGIASSSCRVDSEPLGPCSGPGLGTHTTSPLPDGAHTFEVRLTDHAGNTDPTPATYNFTVDTTPPVVTIDTGPSAPTNDSTPTFTFSANEFIPLWQCRVDSAPFGTCGPVNGTHTTAELTDGDHTFRVLGTDPAGNSHQVARTFTVDTVAPETFLDSSPISGMGWTNDATPTFGFSSDEASASFACTVDGDEAAPCTSPHTLPALADGPHSFTVAATDPAGNVDETPIFVPFGVDTVDPVSSITFPEDGVAYRSAAFAAGCEDETPDICGGAADPAPASGVNQVQVSVQRASDGSFWNGIGWGASEVLLGANGVNPWTREFTPEEDTYTVTARALDFAGNVEGTSVVVFTVDDTPPETTITAGPGGTSDVSFAFTATEPGSTFVCSLDGMPATACSSPTGYSGLAPGMHSFAVAATDPAGNADPTSASATWTVPQPPGGQALPMLTISNAKVKEGNRGTKAMRFLVRLSTPSDAGDRSVQDREGDGEAEERLPRPQGHAHVRAGPDGPQGRRQDQG
jgi:uncharacterized delta-60 repeat protein